MAFVVGIEVNANEDSVKMNEKEGLTEMLVEMGTEEEGASVGSEIAVLLDGCGKVMVGIDESETELEGGTPTELAEEEESVGAGGVDEEESVGEGGADEEEPVGTGGAEEEESVGAGGTDEEESVGAGGADEEESVGAGGALEEAEEDGGVGMMLEMIELRVLIISPGFEEEVGGGGVGMMLEIIELRVLKISPGFEEEGGGGGLELAVFEVGVAEGVL